MHIWDHCSFKYLSNPLGKVTFFRNTNPESLKCLQQQQIPLSSCFESYPHQASSYLFSDLQETKQCYGKICSFTLPQSPRLEMKKLASSTLSAACWALSTSAALWPHPEHCWLLWKQHNAELQRTGKLPIIWIQT